MPGGGERIDSAMVACSARHFRCVNEINFAVGTAAENADGGPLPFFIFYKKIAVKRVVVAGQEADGVPASAAAPFP